MRTLQAQGIIPQDLTRKDGQADPQLPAYFSDPKFYFSPDDRGGAPEFSPVASEMTWAAVQGYDLTTEIAQLQLPILVLCGKDDPYAQMSEAVVAALASAKASMWCSTNAVTSGTNAPRYSSRRCATFSSCRLCPESDGHYSRNVDLDIMDAIT